MTVTLLNGDCREVLASLPDASVQCIVTSPPYWGLRDYGVDGQIGLEPTWTRYVERMVEVFAEARRVLADDGVLWLNLGDCYATGAGAVVGDHPGGGEQGAKWAGTLTQPNRMPQPNLKAKDLVGIPWAVAFALRADGWYLRQALPWIKRNGMPESTKDRPIQTVETFFLLTKGERYTYDYEAVKQAAKYPDGPNGDVKSPYGQGFTRKSGNKARKPASARGVPMTPEGTTNGAVAGSVPWEGDNRAFRANDLFLASIEPPHGLISAADGEPLALDVVTKPYTEAHFATFPPELIRPLILAGCPEGGTVLDPFGGAGTTGLVADSLKRNAVLIDLNPKYVAMADRRIHGDLFAKAAP